MNWHLNRRRLFTAGSVLTAAVVSGARFVLPPAFAAEGERWEGFVILQPGEPLPSVCRFSGSIPSQERLLDGGRMAEQFDSIAKSPAFGALKWYFAPDLPER